MSLASELYSSQGDPSRVSSIYYKVRAILEERGVGGGGGGGGWRGEDTHMKGVGC